MSPCHEVRRPRVSSQIDSRRRPLVQRERSREFSAPKPQPIVISPLFFVKSAQIRTQSAIWQPFPTKSIATAARTRRPKTSEKGILISGIYPFKRSKVAAAEGKFHGVHVPSRWCAVTSQTNDCTGSSCSRLSSNGLWRAYDAASLLTFVPGCKHRAYQVADALNLTETLSYCQKWAYSER